MKCECGEAMKTEGRQYVCNNCGLSIPQRIGVRIEAAEARVLTAETKIIHIKEIIKEVDEDANTGWATNEIKQILEGGVK